MFSANDRWLGVLKSMVQAGFTRILTATTARRHGTSDCVVFRTTCGGFIKVYRSTNKSAVYPIAFFRHTLLMNYASFDHISVAYPALTFARQGVITSRNLTASDQMGIASDRGNGYDLRDSINALTCRSSPMCPRALRSMRDVKCCILRFTGKRVRLVRYNVEWKLGGIGCSSACHRFSSLQVLVRDATETWV